MNNNSPKVCYKDNSEFHPILFDLFLQENCGVYSHHAYFGSTKCKTLTLFPFFGKKHVLTSWCGGEQGSSRSLAVTVWELRPVLQLDHTGRDGTAPGLLRVS